MLVVIGSDVLCSDHCISPEDKQIAPSLAGKVAVVSGSSSGIGTAIARALSGRGANVVINYSFKENADQVLRGLKGSAKSIAVEADLSTIAGPTKLAAAAAESFWKNRHPRQQCRTRRFVRAR
ncbi:uncharacterized protein Z518_07546 [Rhinocladiella mackenziei CBS 650.93]|uniref:Uncharacterized protein n=1 Tax=Rhinocladiella mackenziei CBS 650.93 TaxID=1442369 RepID=A0A0D2H0Q4_9EURO|nr:uncharacterized protein Z518_07546 [Rhinocladiella mackenziei CBS 650.93]KIX03993.1 hypothetical protein Z518_07546 [Rhinocladiella mackenziei CBS 650.93]